MSTQIIFFQGGGGKQDYDVDVKLVASLKSNLGSSYVLLYPLLNNEETPDFGRRKQINNEISLTEDGVIIVAHSLSASMLLKHFSESDVTTQIAGVFLMSTPFWNGDEDWKEPLKLQDDFAEKLNRNIPLFFYHCRDDEEVPFHHLAFYQRELPWATFRELSTGGHQLGNDLTVVAKDIVSIQR